MLIEFKIYTLIFFNNNVRNDRTNLSITKIRKINCNIRQPKKKFYKK